MFSYRLNSLELRFQAEALINKFEHDFRFCGNFGVFELKETY